MHLILRKMRMMQQACHLQQNCSARQHGACTVHHSSKAFQAVKMRLATSSYRPLCLIHTWTLEIFAASSSRELSTLERSSTETLMC